MNSAALILAAHGSHHEPGVNQSIRNHALALASEWPSSTSNEFDEILVAFHQGEPHFSKVLDSTSATRIVVVPVMTSSGYYCDDALPRELLRARRCESADTTDRRPSTIDNSLAWIFRCFDFSTFQLAITPPVGSHPDWGAFLADRINLRCAQHGLDSQQVTVALVGHGTPRHDRSRATTESLAVVLRQSGACGEILTAFLDDQPGIETMLDRATKPHVLVVPFLIGGGPHTVADIPCRLGWPMNDMHRRTLTRSVWIDDPVGALPAARFIIRDLALEGIKLLHNLSVVTNSAGPVNRQMVEDGQSVLRASKSKLHSDFAQAEACGSGSANLGLLSDPPPSIDIRQSTIDNPPVLTFRLGTRRSALALWQARHVQERLAEHGIRVELVEITTSGDRALNCAIADLPSDTPFTDDLETALRRGEIDFAVHALKDVPVPPPGNLELVAVLPRGDVTESLVSRHHQRLSELPPGAVVGTSSPRRVAQLLVLRPNLIARAIRGPVGDRLAQVRRGDFDAAILATAGLQRLGLTAEIAETFSLDDFLPAPGQGALVLQIHRNGNRLCEQLGPLNHLPTRRAVTAELALLRRFQDDPDWTLSAWADTAADGRITLRARLTACDGSRQLNESRIGENPIALAASVARRLRLHSTFDIRPSTIPA